MQSAYQRHQREPPLEFEFDEPLEFELDEPLEFEFEELFEFELTSCLSSSLRSYWSSSSRSRWNWSSTNCCRRTAVTSPQEPGPFQAMPAQLSAVREGYS
ncbi:hypothetical protein AJ88_21030 [Mesorhizobium amorphae CCBAU 01583]|nr:hypothetical protein AJ88_21030 [Mesorhizobium amorphae CCBAU 01583]